MRCLLTHRDGVGSTLVSQTLGDGGSPCKAPQLRSCERRRRGGGRDTSTFYSVVGGVEP